MAVKVDVKNTQVVSANIKAQVKSIKTSTEKALKLIGLDGETLAIQASPVDTGRLKNSMTHQVGDDFVVIGTNVEYAIYLEVKGKHKGWFRRVYNQLVPRAKEIFRKELKR